jgi:hypothetical protein
VLRTSRGRAFAVQAGVQVYASGRVMVPRPTDGTTGDSDTLLVGGKGLLLGSQNKPHQRAGRGQHGVRGDAAGAILGKGIAYFPLHAANIPGSKQPIAIRDRS